MTRSARTGSTSNRTFAVLLAVFLGGSLVLAGAVAVNELGGDGGGGAEAERPELSRAGSSVVDRSPASPLLPTRTPASYDVVYRVEAPQGERLTVTNDRIRVRRPFDGRVDSSAGGGRLTSRVSRFGALVLDNGRGQASVIASPPSISTADVRVDVSLSAAAARGTVSAREQRTVAGRRCQVWRFGSTVTAGRLVPVGTTPG